MSRDRARATSRRQRRRLAAITGHYDSDEGPVDLLPCGRRLCARLAGVNQDLPAPRQGANEYAVRPGVDARFDTEHGEPWSFVYSGASSWTRNAAFHALVRNH